MPGRIPPEAAKEGVFLFLGKCLPVERLNYELILDDFDELLPLYRYVESGGKLTANLDADRGGILIRSRLFG